MRRSNAVFSNAVAKTPHPRPFSTKTPHPFVPSPQGGEGKIVAKVPAYIVELCRKFRKEPTTAEKLLWRCLRDRQLAGLKFRRQHPLGRYIADFYCAEARLVVELEGKVHSKKEQREYDQIRKEELEARGLQVLRFENEEALKRTERVLAKIAAVAAKLASDPSP